MIVSGISTVTDTKTGNLKDQRHAHFVRHSGSPNLDHGRQLKIEMWKLYRLVRI